MLRNITAEKARQQLKHIIIIQWIKKKYTDECCVHGAPVLGSERRKYINKMASEINYVIQAIINGKQIKILYNHTQNL